MCNDTKSLPSIEFVGGETQSFAFNIFTKNTENPTRVSKAVFSIISCTNKFGTPIVSKNMTVSSNKISVSLTSQETINLSGKFLYQIVIKDANNEIEIPDHGVLYIKNNIDKNGTTKL